MGTLNIPLPRSRRRLVAVIRAAGDVIRAEDVVATLAVERTEASAQLSRWTKQGWLRRVERGAYVAASLDLLDSECVLEDPWVLVPALFSPAYVGGRTAAEYWGLTDQMFRDTVVMTTKPIREKHQVRHSSRFTLYRVSERKFFGMETLQCGKSKVLVSDAPRTMVDLLDNGDWGGGIQHVSDCFLEYLWHKERDDEKLIHYAETLANGAVFKRLGFLAEGQDAFDLAEACRTRLTRGDADLEPGLPRKRRVSRWRLWIPPAWQHPQRQ